MYNRRLADQSHATMRYNFDEPVDRKNTNCYKYDYAGPYFGTDDLIPMWVADMDFRTPDFIMEAILERSRHEVLGYTVKPDSTFRAVINWYKRQQDWSIKQDWIQFAPGVEPDPGTVGRVKRPTPALGALDASAFQLF